MPDEPSTSPASDDESTRTPPDESDGGDNDGQSEFVANTVDLSDAGSDDDNESGDISPELQQRIQEAEEAGGARPARPDETGEVDYTDSDESLPDAEDPSDSEPPGTDASNVSSAASESSEPAESPADTQADTAESTPDSESESGPSGDEYPTASEIGLDQAADAEGTDDEADIGSVWGEITRKTITVRGIEITMEEPENDDRIVNAFRGLGEDAGNPEFTKAAAQLVVVDIDFPGVSELTDDIWEHKMTPMVRSEVGQEALELLGVDFSDGSASGPNLPPGA